MRVFTAHDYFFAAVLLIFGNSICNLYGVPPIKYVFIGAGHLILTFIFATHFMRFGVALVVKLAVVSFVLVIFLGISFIRGQQVFDNVNLYLGCSSLIFLSTGMVYSSFGHIRSSGRFEWALPSAYALVCLLGLYKINEISNYDVSRNFDSFGLHPVGIGMSFGFLCQVAIFNVLHKKGIAQLVWGLAIFASFLVVFSTGSRGAIVALILVNSLILGRFLGRVRAIIILLVIFVSLVLLWFFGKDYLVKVPIFDRLILAFDRTRYTLGPRGYVDLSGRIEIWSYYLRTWDSWIMFGEKGYVPYPHNSFLESFVRFGVTGILLVIPIFVVSAKAIKGIFKEDLIVFLMAQLFLLDLLISLVNASLEMHRLLFLGIGYFLFTMFSQWPTHRRNWTVR